MSPRVIDAAPDDRKSRPKPRWKQAESIDEEQVKRLKEMSRELQNSRALIEIPTMVDQFETDTNRAFNHTINIEYLKNYRADPAVKTKTEVTHTLKQARQHRLQNMLQVESFGSFRFSARAKEVISPLKLTSVKSFLSKQQSRDTSPKASINFSVSILSPSRPEVAQPEALRY